MFENTVVRQNENITHIHTHTYIHYKLLHFHHYMQYPHLKSHINYIRQYHLIKNLRYMPFFTDLKFQSSFGHSQLEQKVYRFPISPLPSIRFSFPIIVFLAFCLTSFFGGRGFFCKKRITISMQVKIILLSIFCALSKTLAAVSGTSK